MSWNSGPMTDGREIVTDRLVTVAELLHPYEHTCGIPGPSWSKCMRWEDHPSPCAALGTDSEGVPIVVCWWPAGMFPTGVRQPDPGS
jgi:hypothetical protein